MTIVDCKNFCSWLDAEFFGFWNFMVQIFGSDFITTISWPSYTQWNHWLRDSKKAIKKYENGNWILVLHIKKPIRFKQLHFAVWLKILVGFLISEIPSVTVTGEGAWFGVFRGRRTVTLIFGTQYISPRLSPASDDTRARGVGYHWHWTAPIMRQVPDQISARFEAMNIGFPWTLGFSSTETPASKDMANWFRFQVQSGRNWEEGDSKLTPVSRRQGSISWPKCLIHISQKWVNSCCQHGGQIGQIALNYAIESVTAQEEICPHGMLNKVLVKW